MDDVPAGPDVHPQPGIKGQALGSLPPYILCNGNQWIAAFQRGTDGGHQVVKTLGTGHLVHHREHVGTQMVAAVSLSYFDIQRTHEGWSVAHGAVVKTFFQY